MSTVKATRITLVVDEGWMEVIAQHHGERDEHEVFTWESSEPVAVEVEDGPPELTFHFTSVSLDPRYDFEADALISHGSKVITAHYQMPRDEDEPSYVELFDEKGEEVELDIEGVIKTAMEGRVTEYLSQVDEYRRVEEALCLRVAMVVPL